MSEHYRLSVGSLGDFERVVAEIEFPGKLVVLIDEDKGRGQFEATFRSLEPDATTLMQRDGKSKDHSIPLDALLKAIDEATARLAALDWIN
jgi:hypothetical protein